MASADLLLHPVRLRIMRAFLGGRTLTTGELSGELADVPTASLYRHVARLVDAGVLAIVGERRVRGALERTYELRAARLGPEDVATMTIEDHRQAFMAFVAGLLGDFDRYLAGGDVDLARDGVTYNMDALWLDDDEYADVMLRVNAILRAQVGNQPTPGRKRRIIASALLLGDPPRDRSPAGREGAPHMSADLQTAATTVLTLALDGRFAEIRDMFAEPLRDLVTAEAIETAWRKEITEHGAVVGVGTPFSEAAGPGLTMVTVPVHLMKGDIALLATMTAEADLTGLRLVPAKDATPPTPWEPPEYADPSTFDEDEVAVGDVPGTLTTPKHPAGVAVLLLAGSGPEDRDGTLGRNKPLKDLAWGLATRGVTVLRFDKVTYAHPETLTPDTTLVDEYLHHAAAGLQLIRDSAYTGKIFVVGHSLGGTVAPRAAAAEPDVAGIVLLAAGAVPIHRSAVRQARYLSSTNPAMVPLLERLITQADAVDSPDLSPDTPAADLPFGVPAPYWLDLRAYDPVATARALHRPILIMQGGRDYQVTVADDLPLWQAGLPDATVRVYPEDNHFFYLGSGPSTDAEYITAQHVDVRVVEDVAAWLKVAQ